MSSRPAARLAACSLAVALAAGPATPAAAQHRLRAYDPPPAAPAPTAPPNADTDRYCKQDPDWYLCQRSHPPR
jgi:hypothetical protein